MAPNWLTRWSKSSEVLTSNELHERWPSSSFGKVCICRKKDVCQKLRKIMFMYEPRNINWREKLCTVILLIKIPCSVKKFVISKAANPNKFEQGRHWYWALPWLAWATWNVWCKFSVLACQEILNSLPNWICNSKSTDWLSPLFGTIISKSCHEINKLINA